MYSPPFAGCEQVAVVVPTRLNDLAEADRLSLENIPAIFKENRAALERELGAPLRIVQADPGSGPRWLIGPAACNPALLNLARPEQDQPELFLDRAEKLLVSVAPDAAGVWETFSLLRTLARFEGGSLKVGDCQNVEEAIRRIEEEVADSFPSFRLRGLNWAAICEKHRDRVRSSATPEIAMQEWLAELQDGHTWVRPAVPPGDLPYEVWIGDETATFTNVPASSAAWEAGVRPGFHLLDQDPAGWWRRTASTPHARPLVAGRRLLQGHPGSTRELVAASPSGKTISWEEIIPLDSWHPIATWKILPSGTGYLKIRAWIKGKGLEETVDEAFEAFHNLDRLIVDLRGNPGGDLTLAVEFRNRFLQEKTVMGSIRYSVSHNILSEPEPIIGEPLTENKRWLKKVRFLTDPQTYSASEDVLLGLQGLEQVEVLGEPGGGGSGRLRVLRLLPGWRLTISTALTFDRQGRCVEGAGIPVDRLILPDRFNPAAEDTVLREADRGW